MKRLRLFFIFTLFISNSISQAKNANQNEVTDFFEKNIEDPKQYLQNLESIKSKNIEDIKHGANISNSLKKRISRKLQG